MLAHDPLPRSLRPRGIAELLLTEPHLQERLGHLRACRVSIDHPLKFGQRRREIALTIVRFADPVLRVGRQRVLREPLRQLAELEQRDWVCERGK